MANQSATKGTSSNGKRRKYLKVKVGSGKVNVALQKKHLKFKSDNCFPKNQKKPRVIERETDKDYVDTTPVSKNQLLSRRVLPSRKNWLLGNFGGIPSPSPFS